MTNLTRIIIFLSLILSSINIVSAKKADLSFLVIPQVHDVTTSACNIPVLATYTVIAGTPVPLTLQKIELEKRDTYSEDAVTIVSSATHSCKQGQQLGTNQTCNITVSFQPCDLGQIERKLIIEINTSQGLLEDIISTQVKKPALQVAAGNSQNSSGLIVQSQDNGFTWENVTTKVPHLPEKLNFDNASCNLDNTCIVVGWDQLGTSPPLLVTTLDTGKNWSKVTSVLDTDGQPTVWPERGRFDSAACSGKVCVAVGVDFTNNDDAPLIFNTQDAGKTWFERSITDGPNAAELFGASCNENKLCIIVGTSDSLVLASSTNAGTTWAPITTLYNKKVKKIPFPDNATFTNGQNPSCSESICIAGGNIMPPWDPDVDPFPPSPAPFLISSTSPGIWTQVTSALPAKGNLNGFSCSGDLCVAVGGYQSSILIVYTHDAGKTWTQVPQLLNSKSLPAGSLDNVSCYGNNCVAGSGTDTGPLLLTSQDGGISWAQITTATGGGFPTYGRIFTTGCSANICMAGGGDITNPTYLLTSNDGGKTWNNVNSIVFPSDGLINTVSISR